MTRLRRSDCSRPGISRRKRGNGFSYRTPDGQPVSADDVERIKALAIPPAWKDVWICPWPNGHIQAVGTDDAGRRQYRYHDDWRVRRNQEKFTRVVDFADQLPKVRKRVARDLAGSDLGRDRVMAAIVRLLDVGLFRIGGDDYAEEHETFGVASLLRSHVHVHGDLIEFDYLAKSSIQRTVEVRDPHVAPVISALRRRRARSPRLFAYRNGRSWTDVHAPDVNQYIKSIAGEAFTAKDFRTWSATVLAAVALGGSDPVPASRTGRRRAVVDAVKTVAAELGNTPAVSRSSYVDPRVIDRFEGGETLRDHIERPGKVADLAESSGARRHHLEEAVVALIEGEG